MFYLKGAMTGRTKFKGLIAMISLAVCLSGCSPDMTEISEIAMVMAFGIDYDTESRKYTVTSYSVVPSALSAKDSGKLSEWVISAKGDSILEASKNLRSRSGRILIWQHNKFVLVGETAARRAFFEIVDFLNRNRQIRMTSYLLVSEGKAIDKLNDNVETEDLLSNDLLGKVRNEKEWGKSVSQILQDIANWYPNPYRGFVTGRIGISKLPDGSRDALVLNGGAVIDKGKFKAWLDGERVIAVQLLSDKSKWGMLEFARSFEFQSSQVSLFFRVEHQRIDSRCREGKPEIDIRLTLSATMGEIDHQLPLGNPETIVKLEQAASDEIEKLVRESVAYYQKVLKSDILGFSERFAQYYPDDWEMLQKEWGSVYPVMPVSVHAKVKVEKMGMVKYTGVD